MVFIDDAIKSAEEDMLGFDKYAKMIKGLIDDAKDKPFSIGINGKWGSGKSSLLNLVKNELEEDLKTSDNQQSESAQKANEKLYKGYIIVEFDAWLYQGYYDARVALLEQLFEKIEPKHQLKKQMKKVINLLPKTINMVNQIWSSQIFSYLKPFLIGILSLLSITTALNQFFNLFPKSTGSIISLIFIILIVVIIFIGIKFSSPISLDSDIKNLREAIEKHLDKGKKKLVVLVDDLDRCQPATAIATLEAIRLFLHINRTVILLASDKEVLQQAVKKQFVLNNSDVDDRASAYFDRLINIELKIPRLTEKNLKKFLEKLLDKELGNKFTDKEISSLSQVITYTPHLHGDIRKLKQIFNKFSLIEKLLDKDAVVNPMLIVKLLLLEATDNSLCFQRIWSAVNYEGEYPWIFTTQNRTKHLLQEEQFYIDETTPIRDRHFIKLWLLLPPLLTSNNDDLYLEDTVNLIAEQWQGKEIYIQRYTNQEVMNKVKNNTIFPDLALIKTFKENSFYDRILFYLALNRALEEEVFVNKFEESNTIITLFNLLLSFDSITIQQLALDQHIREKDANKKLLDGISPVLYKLKDMDPSLITFALVKLLCENYFINDGDSLSQFIKHLWSIGFGLEKYEINIYLIKNYPQKIRDILAEEGLHVLVDLKHKKHR
ncbi:P-loop NTPase fold protein (plasmid) [Entomospira nematocerorum]|uniref:KAP NTPase domain-containing protein n=1 Tax=Entomospira nematocerorum TaxID=2719987 RepID=A0A968GDH2_9SPIO|nr:P-loop NTPase fold protein [Entomospira nematocera]NIZ47842.1 hypothetical protein [Entomospira nematocera]WDI34792.1 P-loop NTPase fold protein [Entomospira nematocera]